MMKRTLGMDTSISFINRNRPIRLSSNLSKPLCVGSKLPFRTSRGHRYVPPCCAQCFENERIRPVRMSLSQPSVVARLRGLHDTGRRRRSILRSACLANSACCCSVNFIAFLLQSAVKHRTNSLDRSLIRGKRVSSSLRIAPIETRKGPRSKSSRQVGFGELASELQAKTPDVDPSAL